MKEFRRSRTGPWPHALAWAVLTIVGAVLFTLSFQRWGHPIIDLGRDLYVPSQLLDGTILYRQLLYNYGPVAPYLLAAVTAVVGDGLRVFASLGILVGVLSTAALYAIGVRLGGVANGFAAALLFVTLSLFANSTWGANFVLPYSFSATLGTLFSLGSFLFLHRRLYGNGPDGARSTDLTISVILMLAALFTKAEIGLAIGLVHVLAWWAHRLPVRAALFTLLSALGSLGLFAATFAARGDDEHSLWGENLGKFTDDGVGSDFFAVVAGTEAPLQHLGEAAVAAGSLALIVALAAFAGSLLDPSADRRAGGRWIALAAAAVAVTVIWLEADVRWMRILPFAAIGIIAYLARSHRRDPLLLVAAYALFSGPRIALQYHPLWYGFYLAVPGYLLLTYGLGVRLPERLPGRRLVVAALAATMLLVVGRYSATSWNSWSRMTSVLETAKGTLRDLPTGRSEAITGFLEWWRLRPDPGGERLVVLPEGVSLNYFIEVPNPTAYYLFTPPEIGSAAIGKRMLTELEAAAPEFVVVTSRDVGEFGFTGIGIDYGLTIGDWLRRDYSVVRWFPGPGSTGWRLLLLQRDRTGEVAMPGTGPG